MVEFRRPWGLGRCLEGPWLLVGEALGPDALGGGRPATVLGGSVVAWQRRPHNIVGSLCFSGLRVEMLGHPKSYRKAYQKYIENVSPDAAKPKVASKSVSQKCNELASPT